MEYQPTEDVTVDQGRGLIEVRTTGDGFAELFYVKGKPITLSWSVSCGSILQNFIRTDGESLGDELKEFRDQIATSFDPNKPLAPQIQPVLDLLPSGQYRISYEESVKDSPYREDSEWEAAEFSLGDLNPKDRHEGFPDYPLNPTIICTVASDALDLSRISEFEKAIDQGARPPLILLRAQYGVWDLLIDGHHKLQAYRKRRLVPSYVQIVALTPTEISHGDAGAIVGETPNAADYKESLTTWRRDTGFFGWAGAGRIYYPWFAIALLTLTTALVINLCKVKPLSGWAPSRFFSALWIVVSLFLMIQGRMLWRRNWVSGYLALGSGLLFLVAWIRFAI